MSQTKSHPPKDLHLRGTIPLSSPVLSDSDRIKHTAEQLKDLLHKLDAADHKMDGTIHREAALAYLDKHIPEAFKAANVEPAALGNALLMQTVRDGLEHTGQESFPCMKDEYIDQTAQQDLRTLRAQQQKHRPRNIA